MKIIHLVWMILVLSLPVTAAAEAELPAELVAAIKGADFTTDRIGLFIQGVEDDKPLVALHADRFLNPTGIGVRVKILRSRVLHANGRDLRLKRTEHD